MAISNSSRAIDSFLEYFQEAKPYHTKLLEVIEEYRFFEEMYVCTCENLRTDVSIINTPLCKQTGFGLDYDDDCGYDAIDCCDLFDCDGGYGFIFDNSDLLVEETITKIDPVEVSVAVSGNHIADTKIPVKEIVDSNNAILKGNLTDLLNKHSISVYVNVLQFEILSNSNDSIILSGNQTEFIQTKNNFRIENTETKYNGQYTIRTVNYDPINNQTDLRFVPRGNIEENALVGINLHFRNSNPNVGIYQIENFSINGENDTVVTFSGNIFNHVNLSDEQLGSFQFRTGLQHFREVDIIEAEDDYHTILYTEYNYLNNETILHLDGDVSSYDVGVDTVKLYGYFFGSGYDGAEDCTKPKESHIYTLLEENLIISIDDDLIQLTPTPTPTPSPTQSIGFTPTPTPSVSDSATPTPTPSTSESATPTPTPSISESATPTPTPSISESATPTPTPSISESVTPTPTPSVSESATPTPTPSVSDSATPTPTPSISESVTPTPSPSVSESVTPTPTPTPSISESATPTPTPSISESVTPTPTPSPSQVSMLSINSISPTSGDEAGGTDVTITGQNFNIGSAATVTFGGTDATNITVVSDTEITCTTPTGTGTVDVVVTQGSESDTLVGGFEFADFWTPEDVAGALWFDASEDSTVTTAGGSVSAVVDKNAGGNDLFQSTPGEQPSHTLSTSFDFGSDEGLELSSFSYTAMSIFAVASTNSSTENHVTRHGSDTWSWILRWQSGADFRMLSDHDGGRNDIMYSGVGTGPAIISYTAVSSGLITRYNGDDQRIDTTGTGNLRNISDPISVGSETNSKRSLGGPLNELIFVPGGTSSNDARKIEGYLAHKWGLEANLPINHPYKSSPPLQASIFISPTTGAEAGGTDVTITGENFDTGVAATVTFGGTDATNIVVVSSTEITCKTPAGTGSVDVVVTQGGKSYTLIGGYEYVVPPPVTSGLIARWKVGSLSGFSDGDLITSIPDSSGSGNDADATDATYVANAVNGGPAIQIGNANGKVIGVSAGVSISDAVSEVLVWRPLNWNGNNPGGWRSDSDSFGGEFFIYQGSTGRPWIRWNGTNVLQPSTGHATSLNTNAVTVYIAGNNGVAEFWENGSLRHSANHSTVAADFQIFKFGSQGLDDGERVDCYIVERLLYDRVLTAQEISDITAWANATYFT